MERVRTKIIGIVGGMGPMAGGHLFDTIIKNTRARVDQDHLSVILASLPRDIADRTLFLQGKTSINPAYEIARVICKLEQMGAEVVGMACNTAYAPEILEVIKDQLLLLGAGVHLLDMPKETCLHITNRNSSYKKIGLLSTNGTYEFGSYQHKLTSFGFTVIPPEKEFQNEVIHRIVYDPRFGVKSNAGRPTEQAFRLYMSALKHFEAKGADAVILGCTEFSLFDCYKKKSLLKIFDSSLILAQALIREATMEVKIL